MKKVRIIAGITWAFACLILIIVLFPGLNSFSASVAKLPFMKINPNLTGGEVSHQIIEASCTLDIRRPVFDGLIKERKDGFVQLDWRGSIPGTIADTIDYNLDGKADFYVMIDRDSSKTIFSPLDEKAVGVIVSTPASYGWALRVKIKK